MLSPALFTNEFSELLENSGISGVQLFPKGIQVLQGQLHLLRDYCLESKLVVNVVKTKVAALRRVVESHSKKDGIMVEIYST